MGKGLGATAKERAAPLLGKARRASAGSGLPGRCAGLGLGRVSVRPVTEKRCRQHWVQMVVGGEWAHPGPLGNLGDGVESLLLDDVLVEAAAAVLDAGLEHLRAQCVVRRNRTCRWAPGSFSEGISRGGAAYRRMRQPCRSRVPLRDWRSLL